MPGPDYILPTANLISISRIFKGKYYSTFQTSSNSNELTKRSRGAAIGPLKMNIRNACNKKKHAKRSQRGDVPEASDGKRADQQSRCRARVDVRLLTRRRWRISANFWQILHSKTNRGVSCEKKILGSLPASDVERQVNPNFQGKRR